MQPLANVLTALAAMPRTLALTPDLVARVPPHDGVTGKLADRPDLSTAAEIDQIAQHLLAQRPADGQVWIFAYGSLIWAPEFDFVEERLATVRGWHRSFCLGWVRLYRGTPERPGVMLGLDRGGSCKGVLFRLPPEAMEANLRKILKREFPIAVTGHLPVRWMKAATLQGTVHAIGFPISRKSDFYLPGLTTETVVQALATAAGERGSMAEYLHSTITHLADRGIHDNYLWHLQSLVAARIAREYPQDAPL